MYRLVALKIAFLDEVKLPAGTKSYLLLAYLNCSLQLWVPLYYCGMYFRHGSFWYIAYILRSQDKCFLYEQHFICRSLKNTCYVLFSHSLHHLSIHFTTGSKKLSYPLCNAGVIFFLTSPFFASFRGFVFGLCLLAPFEPWPEEGEHDIWWAYFDLI